MAAMVSWAVPPARSGGARPAPRHCDSARARAQASVGWHRLALVAILLLSAFLNLFRLSREGNANQYYTATVYSMIQNWHAFFFASFDPAGFVTVDKPPAGFWLQVLSTKLLGFGPLAPSSVR